MTSRLSLVCAALLLLSAFPGATEAATPDPSLTPERAVKIQLEALQKNDEPQQDAGILQTWNFAHPENKTVLGPIERFTMLMKSPFYRLLVDHRQHAVKRVAVTEGTALVAVTVVPASGPRVFYQWRLKKLRSGPLSGSWMTEAVFFPFLRGDSI